MIRTIAGVREAAIRYVAIGSRKPFLALGVTTLTVVFAGTTVLTRSFDFTTLTANVFAAIWSSAEWAKRRRLLNSNRK